MALPDTILVGILESLYADFLQSVDDEISKHHCSLLHPCISISNSTCFEPIHAFRLISTNWNKVFLSTAKLDRYASHRIVQGPQRRLTFIYKVLRKSVLLRRYRIFQNLDIEHEYRSVVLAHDFGVAGGCKESKQVIIKAWVHSDEDYETEERVYETLSVLPMKGCPSLIESNTDPNSEIHVLVLQKLGPSLEEVTLVMSAFNVPFNEKMTLALAIQMLDRYADLHDRKIIHNGVKPGNVCIAPTLTDPSTLYLIDFGCSFFKDDTRLQRGEEYSGNKRFWSVLSHHAFTQSQRDDLESLGYLLSALFQGSLPWDANPWDWRIKMSTPGSTLFCNMDPSFLEYWKDVRTLAFNEIPDYGSLKSHFVKCWERKGFDGSPGEYDWVTFTKKLIDGDYDHGGGGDNSGGQKKTPAAENPPAPVAVAPSMSALGNSSHSAH